MIRRLRLRCQLGYTAVELITVMLILGTVVTGMTTLFVQGSNAELAMNNRFQAQLNARLALDKLRREVHCASSVTAGAGAVATVTLTLPSQCVTGSGSVTWCTQGAGSRYGLYRVGGASCTGGTRFADYLTASTVFTYTAQSTSSLAKLRVDFPVNIRPAKTVEAYELVDDIVLRNSTRS